MNTFISAKTFFISHLTILILSLVFLAGLYYVLNQTDFQTKSQIYFPVTHLPSSFHLEVNSPDNEILVFQKELTISGRTSPKSPVAIYTDSINQAFEADEQGNFSTTITLSTGLNQLTITAFDLKGNSKQEKRVVYYSEEKI